MERFLTNREREILREAQLAYRSEGRIYIKVTSILMLDEGLSPVEVASHLGLHRSTVYQHYNTFLEKGLDDFLDFCVGGSLPSLSESQQALLRSHVSTHFYLRSLDICQYVADTFGVCYSESGMIKLLHRLGFVYKKTRSVPRHPDVETQQSFVEEMSDLRGKLADDEALYFMDGAHPQHNTRAEYGWILKGEDMEIPANTGRKRVNINALMNADDPTEITANFPDRINAQTTIELLSLLLIRYPHIKHHYIICDNARYYYNKVLWKWLEDKPITLIHLPPYAPNLNLIERLWKFLKKEAISSFYYDTYDKFREAIINFFTHPKAYEQQLRSLMTWNFQIIT